MSDKKYESLSREIILGQESVLKTILIKIFTDLYQSLKKSCAIEPQDSNYLDDLIYFHGDMDLIDATKLFRQRFFKHHKLIKFNNIKFSIQDVHSILNTTRFQERMAKKNIIDSIEIQKPYKFSLLAMEEVGRIASELTNIRHMIAHNNNLKQSSQALILMGNVSRLLSITPDSIRETTSGFSELEKFISINYFDSIVEVIRPDIEENRFLEQSIDEDIQEAILINKIDEMSKQLNDLNEIKLVISQNQKISDDISSNFKIIKNELIDEIKNLNQEKGNAETPPITEIVTDKENSKELHIIQDTDIKEPPADITFSEQFMGDPSSWTSVPEFTRNQLKVEDLELHYVSYQNALADGVDKRKVVTWIMNDLHAGYGLTNDDLFTVKLFVEQGLINETLYDKYLLSLEEEDSLSRSELYDKLMSLRVEIKNKMKSESQTFQNWHNILMVALAHEIIDNRIDKEEDFRKNEIFAKYYNSLQMPEKLLERDGIESIKKNAKDLMDTQINDYWDEISSLVGRLT